jgi:hypothetical protein
VWSPLAAWAKLGGVPGSVLLGLFATVAVAALVPSAAAAHSSGCHSAHSCPSDHHTYVWYDGSGQGWSCAEPGAPEYDPSRDTTTITYAGRTYYCYAAGSSAPPPPVDTDGDGVPDSSDACPTEYAATSSGCPPPLRLSGSRAARLTNEALSERIGKLFDRRRHSSYDRSCTRDSDTKVECDVAWSYYSHGKRRYRFRGSVVLRLISADECKYSLSIRKSSRTAKRRIKRSGTLAL